MYQEDNELIQRQGLELDMKYHILHDFRTATSFKVKSSARFIDLYRLKLLTNFMTI